MSAGDSSYTIGYGKPPLHTRFQKGQSGNPSGKPGPAPRSARSAAGGQATLARQRFQRALYAALEGETADLKDARPRVTLDALVRRLTLDAAGGNIGAVKLILSELDDEIAREKPAAAPPEAAAGGQAVAGGSVTEAVEDDGGEQGADEPPPLPDYALWLKGRTG